MTPRPQAGTPDAATLEWRIRLLRREGFTPERAVALAADAGIDLHALIGLTERGCPPSLAERIIAPL